MNVSRNEILRYLGMRRDTVSAAMTAEIDAIEREMLAAAEPRCVYKEVTLRTDGGRIRLADFTVHSENLSRNLSGCDGAVLFAATIGRCADQLMKKYEISNMARAAIAQAVGAAVIEAYCDEINEKIRGEYEGKFSLRPRFSPGYGDFALEHQRDFFRALGIERKIGVTLNESLLMIPTKSVTAVIGLYKGQEDVCSEKCELCTNTSCQYRA